MTACDERKIAPRFYNLPIVIERNRIFRQMTKNQRND